MKLNQFEQLALYCLACLLMDKFPLVNIFVMRCISRKEITGDIQEGIHECKKQHIELMEAARNEKRDD